MSRAQSIGRVAMFRARVAGALARRDGQDAIDCPYDLNGDYYDRARARFWLRGWARADRALTGSGV